MSAVRFMAFADRSWSFDPDVQEISRFSCMLFLSVRGFFDYAGPINPLAINVVVVLPSSLPERSRHPDPSVFRSSIARPTGTSVYASGVTSRCRPQDSRPGWSRCLLSCRALSSPTTCRFSPAHSGLPTTRLQRFGKRQYWLLASSRRVSVATLFQRDIDSDLVLLQGILSQK